ncbi:MAG: hypothetical protein GY716_11275 [bacterium]|nr:hypothetical protein [bacterium]
MSENDNDDKHRMTLREAAERTSRSITTLRRYIRSGRLHADKRYGRFGPEYFVSEEDLATAGLEPGAIMPSAPFPARAVATRAPAPLAAPAPQTVDAVPLTLYQELQMKHEQLLVQYGMMRAGGLRVMDLQAEIDTRSKELEEVREENVALRQRIQRAGSETDKRLREARLELEGRAMEIAALREKVRGLEMLTRNAVTTEAIDKQYERVMEQTERVGRLVREEADGSAAAPELPQAPPPTDH